MIDPSRNSDTSTAPAFDADYYAHGCGRPYVRDDVWLAFFGRIADRIVADLAPRSAMDVGCAMGFLVEALRARGVDARGIDVSDYAIGHAHPDVAPYLAVASAVETTKSLREIENMTVSLHSGASRCPTRRDSGARRFIPGAGRIPICHEPDLNRSSTCPD